MSGLSFSDDASPGHLDAAARIWAQATAARDGDPESASLQQVRPLLRAALDTDAESLLLSAAEDEEPVGFIAAARPQTAGWEIHYLGVRPSAWGRGSGRGLLVEFTRILQTRGAGGAELWVYADNESAVRMYERAGWRFDGRTRVHPRSGRTEHRYATLPE